MALCVMFQRSKLGKFIVFLVFLVIILQVFHMSLLTRLEAKEAEFRDKITVEHTVSGKPFSQLANEIAEKIANSHILDYSGTYHIIPNVLPSEQKDFKDNVTVITQCSSNHLHLLKDLLQSWEGPVSVTVFTYDRDIAATLNTILKLHYCNEQVRQRTSFHLVYPLDRSPESLDNHWRTFRSCDQNTTQSIETKHNYAIEGIEYPHNLLRNLAVRYSSSKLMFMIDIDMIPSKNLHNDFQRLWQRELKWQVVRHQHTAFVIPAFEMSMDINIPVTRSQLLSEWNRGQVRPFYKEACWKCQKRTNYDKWRKLEQTTELQVAYTIEWKDPWEPFFIGARAMPQYDERFKQYGFNRISQVCELHIAGYNFAVLNNAFLIHKGFKDPMKFHKTKDQEQDRNRKLFRVFKEELKVKYPNSTRRCY